MPTQGSANPGLTIQALAARTADYLISQGESVFISNDRDMTAPPIRRNLAPPETWAPEFPASIKAGNIMQEAARNEAHRFLLLSFRSGAEESAVLLPHTSR